VPSWFSTPLSAAASVSPELSGLTVIGPSTTGVFDEEHAAKTESTNMDKSFLVAMIAFRL
jgi:hypothetical protein